MTWPEELPLCTEAGAERSHGSVTREICDVSLMEEALRGNGVALDDLLDTHWSAIVAYVSRLLDGDRDAAKDVAQEVFLRIWQRRVSWQPTGSVRGFLYGLARNLSLNQRRATNIRSRAVARVQALLQEWSAVPTPHELLEQGELKAALDRAITSLPPRRREIFILVRVHGLSYREVAEILEVSPQTVANQMSAALSELRRIL